MLQILLVDDERSVVETLAETIPWESCGISTVHEALSGAVALEIMENHDIDIVITDIRMPEMSGIDLITTIHEKWPHVQTILLSGFADFEYAKQAMAQESFDYLLKPVSDEDLIETVQRLVDRIKQSGKPPHPINGLCMRFRIICHCCGPPCFTNCLQAKPIPLPRSRTSWSCLNCPTPLARNSACWSFAWRSIYPRWEIMICH